MLDEDDGRRQPASRPYMPSAAVLRVPVNVIVATIELLRAGGRREAGAFWYGTRDATGGGTVAAVIAPQQVMLPRTYRVPSAAMSQMVDLVAAVGLKPLAQIHSHPGPYVEHSPFDDWMASSTRSLSLVFPNYAVWSAPWPQQVGVHEWQDGYWHLLAPAVAARRVVATKEAAVLVRDLRP